MSYKASFRIRWFRCLLPLCFMMMRTSAVVSNPVEELQEIFLACRRDPTWRSLNYKDCQRAMGWYPHASLWNVDNEEMSKMLGVPQEQLWNCYDKNQSELERHDTDSSICGDDNPSCDTDILPSIVGKYARMNQGHVATIQNALSEEEVRSVEILVRCVDQILPREWPFYDDDRASNTADAGQHVSGYSSRYLLQGILQFFLPGVAASIYGAITIAFHEMSWERRGLPEPIELGMRSIEYKILDKNGQLESRVDEGSTYSISIAFSDPKDYEGGYFQLETKDVLFQVPRRSALVFMSDTEHGITTISSGNLRMLTAELWVEEDVPVGLPRPTVEQIEEYRQHRRESSAPSRNNPTETRDEL